MPPPFIPQFSVGASDVQGDVEKIIGYLYDLDAFLSGGDPDGPWTTSGHTADRTLTIGDTLTDVSHVLATLIETLKDKGLL